MSTDTFEEFETDEEFIARVNETLVGQHGIVMAPGEERPKYVGTFVEVFVDGHMFIRFSEELVLLFAPLGTFHVVGEKDRTRYSAKMHCDKLYIGDRSFQDIVNKR